jgi:hypothetical protein
MSFEIIVTQPYTSLVLLNLTSEMELLHEGDARVVVRALNGREQHRLAALASEWTILSKNFTLLSDKVDLLAVGMRESNERIIVLGIDLNNLVNCVAISAVSVTRQESQRSMLQEVYCRSEEAVQSPQLRRALYIS